MSQWAFSFCIFLTTTITATTSIHAASTLYCDVEDSNLSFGLKAVSHQVGATVETFELKLKKTGLAHKGNTPNESQHLVLLFEDLDELRMKAQFHDPDFTFEAYMANSGKTDDAINWNGGYKISYTGQSDQEPLRGLMACSDGY